MHDSDPLWLHVKSIKVHTVSVKENVRKPPGHLRSIEAYVSLLAWRMSMRFTSI